MAGVSEAKRKWYGLERCVHANFFGRESPYIGGKLQSTSAGTAGPPPSYIFPNIKIFIIVFGRKSGTTLAVPAVTVPTPLCGESP